MSTWSNFKLNSLYVFALLSASPVLAQSLDLNGYVHSYGYNTDSWYPYTDGNTYIRVPASGFANFDAMPSYRNIMKVSDPTYTGIALTVDGKVGFGTTSPRYPLDIQGSYIQLNLKSTSPTNEVGVLFSNGSTPKAEVGVAGTSGQIVTGSKPDDLAIKAYSAGNILFATTTASTERMRNANSGYVGIGTTKPVFKLDVSGDINASAVLRIAGTQICSVAGCTSSSDARLKELVQPLENSLEKVLKLQGVSYNWKDKAKYGKEKQIGLIAQDLEKVFPQVVITDQKTGMKSVAYDHLISPIIEAVKSLNAENSQLKQENAAIKAQLNRIEKLLNAKDSKLSSL